jgi:predicted O-linked N-acetylglucosamine transferase (SPINDLY family)
VQRPSSDRRRKELRALAERHLERKEILPALEALDRIIGLGRATADDWRLTGDTLLSVREFAQAAAAFENGLNLDPEHEQSRYGLATALFQLGNVTAAADHFQSLADRFNNRKALVSLATIIPGCPQAGHERVLEVRRRLAERLASESRQDTWAPPPRKDRERLRIGYLSAFFDRANYMKPVWGLINGHDRSRFEIRLFADDLPENGLDWFEPGSQDRAHRTTGLSNDQLIALIREESLDVLVDLNGYSAPPRLPIFVHRLAAVCVAWFNMYATSGLPGIDRIIGDEFVVRTDEERFYSERVARLPQSYLSFYVGHDAPPVAVPPCTSHDHFTFGSLVSQYKVTPAVLDAWSEILKRAPASRLALGNRALGSKCNRDWLYEQFERRGVERARLQFFEPAKHYEFLQYYDQIDIALDAFPYNGGTTTTEAIWQGVPVLTFDGDRWVARTSKTLLMSCHLTEFVLPGAREYVDAAVAWATSPDTPRKLAALRQTMREELLKSPVCQSGKMIRAMEEVYAQ